MDGTDYFGERSNHDARRGPRAVAARRLPHSRRDRQIGLGDILLARGAVTPQDLATARDAQRHSPLPLGQILHAKGILSEAELLSALSELHGISLSSLTGPPPPADLAALLSPEEAIALGAVPWRRVGSATVIALTRPDLANLIRERLPEGARTILTLAPKAQVIDAQIALYGDRMARLAEGQVPLANSCRAWRPRTALQGLALASFALALLAWLAPLAASLAVFGFALLIFGANMALKIAAFATSLRANAQTVDPPPETALLRPPVVTLLVPLYKEREIASTLIANLSKIDYPPEQLDVILAVEADDDTTQAALDQCHLPPWMRCVHVPPGTPRTKPRALNFAMNFARGSIVGIYDAEDRPEPDQIRRVVQRYAEVPPDVGCLQGRLDYYNSRHNWLARSFAIEYANWFRVLLPGVQKLGLFVPLGGTTLFIRRPVLEEVGGWDAHNVTEDAELGLRLARRGYRTEMVDTTTFEEANAAILPWIGQRSRWQKGYLMTWATAMRRPAELWRELGPTRFLAFQVQVLFAVLGFVAAPLLWSFLVKPFGLPHPLDPVMGPWGYAALAAIMVSSLILSLSIGLYATRVSHLRGLRPWLLVQELYYLFATISAWRAVAEMLVKPFWWVKTRHGHFGGADPTLQTDAAPAQDAT